MLCLFCDSWTIIHIMFYWSLHKLTFEKMTILCILQIAEIGFILKCISYISFDMRKWHEAISIKWHNVLGDQTWNMVISILFPIFYFHINKWTCI